MAESECGDMERLSKEFDDCIGYEVLGDFYSIDSLTVLRQSGNKEVADAAYEDIERTPEQLRAIVKLLEQDEVLSAIPPVEKLEKMYKFSERHEQNMQAIFKNLTSECESKK